MATENQATDGVGTVNNIISETYAVIEDWLTAAGADQSTIDALKNNADIKGQIGNAAQVAAAYYEGDASGAAKAVTSIAVGALVTAGAMAIIPSVAVAGVIGIVAGYAFDHYADPYWNDFWRDYTQLLKDFGNALGHPLSDDFNNKIDQSLRNLNDMTFDNLVNLIQKTDQDFNDEFTTATGWVRPRADPLVLDLDGDGVELVAENGAAGCCLTTTATALPAPRSGWGRMTAF